MYFSNGMEAIRDVFFSWSVAASFLCHHMDEYRFMKLTGPIEDLFHGSDIVTIDGPKVFQAEVFEHSLRNESVFQSGFQTVQCAISCSSRLAEIHQSSFTPGQCLLIVLRGTQKIKMTRKSTNRWRV